MKKKKKKQQQQKSNVLKKNNIAVAYFYFLNDVLFRQNNSVWYDRVLNSEYDSDLLKFVCFILDLDVCIHVGDDHVPSSILMAFWTTRTSLSAV